MINEIKTSLKRYHTNQPEFHQSVLEVLGDVTEFYHKEQAYTQYNVAQRLIEPDRIIRFRVCWSDDNNNIHVNRGWRVQFNNALGTYKGGLRFHPTVNESVLKFLGFEQCFKNALTGVPMGGAKGGADFDPKGRSEHEIRRFCEAFMQELHRHIGPEIDVPAGDINVGSREIGYLFGHYLKLTNHWNGVLTGKDPLLGGSNGRNEATGFGLVYFLKEMLHAHEDSIEGKKVLISGSGNVALHAAQKCLAEKAIVLTLSDSKGTLYFKNGISKDELARVKDLKLVQRGQLKEFTGDAQFQANETPWKIQADIALPCATQNEVDKDAASQMSKNGIKVVAEGANMPLTADAQDVIIENNIIYGPAKAANAGGVAVSGLERSQNASLTSWSAEQVDNELKKIMNSIHEQCIKHVYKKEGIYPYRKGANIAAFERLATALVSFGVK